MQNYNYNLTYITQNTSFPSKARLFHELKYNNNNIYFSIEETYLCSLITKFTCHYRIYRPSQYNFVLFS